VPNFVAGLSALGMSVHRVNAYATGAILRGNELVRSGGFRNIAPTAWV
jgi:hypothetical protein